MRHLGHAAHAANDTRLFRVTREQRLCRPIYVYVLFHSVRRCRGSTMTRSTTDEAAAPQLPSPKERRRLREAKSLSEEQVAAAVGVTRATVRSWETGRTSPRGRKRVLYAKLIAPEPEALATTTPAAAMTAPAPVPTAPETVPESAAEPTPVPSAEPAPEAAPEVSPEAAPEVKAMVVTEADTGTDTGEEAAGERRLSPAGAFDELYARTAPTSSGRPIC
ncbi:sigma-70 family RNA polymerase sigma factor [Streptomyces sp. W007]|nr:sigma-70 family RNA polymerase sigma factor [Streptomyces sp. W007]